jgi:hypothetical protein
LQLERCTRGHAQEHPAAAAAGEGHGDGRKQQALGKGVGILAAGTLHAWAFLLAWFDGFCNVQQLVYIL